MYKQRIYIMIVLYFSHQLIYNEPKLILLMDLEDYQTCDLKLQICCDYIDEEIENIILNSKAPCQISQDDIKKIKKQKKQIVIPKSRRELSLGFRSKQLKQRFVHVCQNMPGRVDQAQTVFQFIAHSENGASSPLVLSGHTGCGKTSLIKQVLQFFEKNSNTVAVAYLNCMSARTVNLIYTVIHSSLYQGKKAARSIKPCEALNENFKSGIGKDEKTKIIVLDEVDHVIKEQNFLYNMLQWLNIGAKIILVLISNVVDLTVKLDAKIQSRWKFENIIFPCYNSSQITEIINHKYSNIRNFIPSQTITFLSKKICNLNSDIRTLNKIYQRIQNYYYEHGRKMLTNDIVSSLIEQDTKVASMQHSYSTLLEILEKAQKKTEVSSQVINKLYFIAKNYPKNEDILYMLCDLQDAGLITLTSNRKSCDITFHNYGIKIHENLHFYIENKGEK